MPEVSGSPRVSDILPPERKKTSSSPTRSFRNIGTSGVRSARDENSSGGSPSRYRQLQAQLRDQRGESVTDPATQRERRYGSNRNLSIKRGTGVKLSNTTIGFMVVVAICIDLFQMFLDVIIIGELFVNDIIDIPIELGFFVWFKMNGVSFYSVRKMASFFGTWGIGLLANGTLPFWTLEVLLVAWAQKSEERKSESSPIKVVAPKSSSGV